MRPPTVRVTRPVSGTVTYEVLGDAGTPVPGPRVAIVGSMHGDEPVGAAVLERLDGLLPERLGRGSVLAVRANLEGARLGRRHTPGGCDLNRLWDRQTLDRLARTPQASLCYEEQRALELAPLLLGCDAVLDLHSSSRPSTPFLVMRDDARHLAIARRLGVAHLVTGLHERAVLGGGLCSDVGLRPGESSRRLGFTYEAGQHDDPSNVHGALDVAMRLLHALDLCPEATPPANRTSQLCEVVGRFDQAPAHEPPWELVGYEGGPPGGGRRGPPRRLHSFEVVEGGEIYARRGDQVARAEHSFVMLLPAPSAAPGTELFFFARTRVEEPGVPRAHAEPVVA